MKKSNRRTLFSFVTTLLLAFGLSLVCGIAAGQDEADDSEFVMEEIVVTSEFREKSIQRSPLSISAVNAEILEARNQVSLDQVASQAPNVSLQPGHSQYGSALVAYIRGIGQTDFNPSVEPGVSVYVDDVYYSTITGNILDLLDLERVEILRGPQGTLAGRNAIGGALKIFSRKPDGSEDGFASITVGDYDRLDVRAASGFEILPNTLFMRIAGVSRSRDGYVKRLDYACANNLPEPGTPGGFPTYVPIGSDCQIGTLGAQSMTAGRLSLRWLASETFEVNFATNIVNDKSEVQPNILVDSMDNWASKLFNPNSGVFIPIFYDNDGDGAYTPGVDIGFDSRFATPGTYISWATFIDDGTSTPSPMFQGGIPGQGLNAYKPYVVPPINHLRSEDYTLSLNWQLADDITLLSVTSYREYVNTFAADNDGSPLSQALNLQRLYHDQFTQELRLNATLFDGFAGLTVGGFYLDQNTDEDARLSLNYTGLDFTHGPDPVPATSKAIYGQLVLDLTDRMNLTLGLRYSEDEKSYTFQRHNPDGTEIQPMVGPPPFFAFNPPNSAVKSVDGISVSYSSDRLDYRVALDYTLTEDIMVYGQVATGYKAGGNNARPFFASQLNAFEPEELTNYEVGIKSTLADQLRLNASVFFNDYKDIQLPTTVCTWALPGQQVPCGSQNNVGDAEVKGFEVEAMWRPTEAMMVDLSYSFLDLKYTAIDENATSVEFDMITPYTPENKWSIGAQYRLKLGNGLGDLTPRIDVSYQDEIYSTATNRSSNHIDSRTIANARMTWRAEDRKTEIALEVTNLTDEYYYLTKFDMMPSSGVVTGQPGRPIEWAFTVKRLWF